MNIADNSEMTKHLNPFLAGLFAIVVGAIGIVCTFYPREYRDFNLRHQRPMPAWLNRMQNSSSTLLSIRVCGILALLMSTVVFYTTIANFWR
jgi:hypothetical protein